MSRISQLVCDALTSSDAFGLRTGAPVRATPVLNWGGFVNRSFVVDGGHRRLHVKLSGDADTVRGLRRWWSVRGRLAERCGAPRMIGWMSLPSEALEGAVLEWIAGSAPASSDSATLQRAGELLSVLHGDVELARRLREDGDTIRTCAVAYRESLHARFVEDLRAIRAATPPFVAPAVVQWMTAEAERLRQCVSDCPAFHEAADVATHQDPWLNNVVLADSGSVHLIDWDGLALGDPMMDWALLLGPGMDDLRPADPRELLTAAFNGAALERFALYSRAAVLDWIVDSLADWIEAEGAPRCDEVRAVKQRVHEAALVMYRERYG